jgi:hypothetical protein
MFVSSLSDRDGQTTPFSTTASRRESGDLRFAEGARLVMNGCFDDLESLFRRSED